MRNALKQLQAKTEETELNIELLQMRRRRAQMQQAVYDTLSKNKQDHTQERVRRAEDHVMDHEARAAAMEDEAQRGSGPLDAQLAHLSKQETVEEQLAHMKTRQSSKPAPAAPASSPRRSQSRAAAASTGCPTRTGTGTDHRYPSGAAIWRAHPVDAAPAA